MRDTLKRIETYMAIAAKNTLDAQEAALYIGITPETLYNHLDRYPHYKGKNGRNYFKKSELDTYKCFSKVSSSNDIELDIYTNEAIKRTILR